jgi:hypothetical protein
MPGHGVQSTSPRSSGIGHGIRTSGAHGTDKSLILQGENDFDTDGLALMDEFSGAVAACIKDLFDGNIRVVSSTRLPIDPA